MHPGKKGDFVEPDFKELGDRIRGLREACEVSRHSMAQELGVDVETYTTWEETGADVPISAIYHMAQKFGVEFTEILTGGETRLDTIQVVKSGTGREVNRLPGYHFEDLAWRFSRKIMQPLLVTLDPSDEPAALVTHEGQEFNYVVEGSLVLTYDGREYILDTGDSAYFDPTHLHGQRCHGDVPTKFLTFITE